ncbi:MAG: hypothetical protein JWR77_776 [Rhizorhabdus sp.]|nr:hypothetical protein [Rhizorhabdus sp.]
MSNHYRKGHKVRWQWGAGSVHGHIVERFDRRVQRTIGGVTVVRRGTPENPAYLVETEDGKTALKRGSELHAG